MSRLLLVALLLAPQWLPVHGLTTAGAAAQEADGDEPRIQQTSGFVTGADDTDVFRLSGMQAGDLLSVYAQTTSGNLDPLVALLRDRNDLERVARDYNASLDEVVAANSDIAASLIVLRNQYFLAWDDDSGAGYAATFSYKLPDDGDYLLLVAPALGSLGRETFGEYSLLVGLNAPDVVSGAANPSGEPIATYLPAALGQDTAVQEIAGTLTSAQPRVRFTLEPVQTDTTIYAYAEGTTPGVTPTLILRDFGGKALAAGNLTGSEPVARLRHHLISGGVNHVVEVSASPAPDGQPATGAFRLVIGLNEPDVLVDAVSSNGTSVVQAPIPVQVGVRLNRITGVDNKEESFTMLGSVRMDWRDPAYAFSPDTCNCEVRVFTDEDFRNFLAEFDSRWPDFAIFNQVGPRFPRSRAVAVWSDGRAAYVEDFTATLQADFDFRQFPFDTETFPVFIDMLFGTDSYEFEMLPDYSEISSDHGEDEFIVTDFETFVTTERGITGNEVSRFTFQFTAPRHLDYYLFQIFVPILLIGLISWFTFFLRDYTRRIEAAAANVLLFIAFSFSLSDNYPRLGYLTFLDAIMLVTFIINTLVILYNVYLKQLESNGRVEHADAIDRYFDWVYPIGYVLMILIVVWIFFWRG